MTKKKFGPKLKLCQNSKFGEKSKFGRNLNLVKNRNLVDIKIWSKIEIMSKFKIWSKIEILVAMYLGQCRWHCVNFHEMWISQCRRNYKGDCIRSCERQNGTPNILMNVYGNKLISSMKFIRGGASPQKVKYQILYISPKRYNIILASRWPSWGLGHGIY